MSQSVEISSTLFNATIEALSRHAPFDKIERPHLDFMVRRLRLGFYPQGAVILEPQHGDVRHFYIIKQGSVLGEQPRADDKDPDPTWQLSPGECFPLGALLARRPVVNIYRASQDTFCYELDARHFDELVRTSIPFHDFCTRRIANLLEHSRRDMQAHYSLSSTEQQSWMSPLRSLVRRKPVHCSPQTSVLEVLRVMKVEDVGSMLITEENQVLGIFTLHDLLDKVALPQQDMASPISTVMSREVVTLPAQALAHDAAVLMARLGIHHVPIVEENQLVGLISERDLFSLQRVGLTQIHSAIRRATSTEELQKAKSDIHVLTHNMLAQGIAAEQVTQIISTLNDALTTRIIERRFSEAGLTDFRFCWLALGSEGRLEQTLSTDQDNGLIFPDMPGSAAGVRDTLLPVLTQVNHDLNLCGFPLCQGGIMASNPLWCLSLSEWKEKFATWIDQGDPQALLEASIFFDFRPLAGDFTLAEELRDWLSSHAAANPRFLYQMAQNALRNRPPLGLVHDLMTAMGGQKTTMVDLKLHGAMPFVDAARIFSLAAGVNQTNTSQRLREAAHKLNIPQGEILSWIEAFYFIQSLRLRQHEGNAGGGNHINPQSLNELDRRILKEAFRQARKLQARLAMDYGL